MTYNRILIFALMVMVSMVAAPAYPADELFDTAAASQHLEQGIASLKAGDFDAAIREFDDSATIAPEAEAYYYLAYAYYMKGKKGDSESRKLSLEYFEKVYELDPNFTPTRYKPSEPVPQPTVKQPPAPEQPKP
jgi:tetratricopeptide (TPR) repeat protein